MKALGLAVVVLALVGFAVWSLPGHDAAGHILITDAIARPVGERKIAAIFTIENLGEPDRLMAVSSSVGAAYLAAPDGLGAPVPVGKASLALDAAFVEITPDTALSHGALVPVTVTFAKAGEVRFKARIDDPAKRGDAGKMGLMGIGDICIVGDDEPAPAISLEVLPEPDGWRVKVDAQDFTFSEDLLGLFHVPGMGHGHLYVGGMKLGRMFSSEATIGALPPGRHQVRVTLNTNDHRAYVVNGQPVSAYVTIDVD